MPLGQQQRGCLLVVLEVQVPRLAGVVVQPLGVVPLVEALLLLPVLQPLLVVLSGVAQVAEEAGDFQLVIPSKSDRRAV